MASIYNKLHTGPVLQEITHWARIYEKLHKGPEFTRNYTHGQHLQQITQRAPASLTTNYTLGQYLREITQRARVYNKLHTGQCLQQIA